MTTATPCIVECTPGSEGWCAVLAHALVAFFGDSTCSADNTATSCFGAEWCDRRIRPVNPETFVTNLMRRNKCYAAIDCKTKTFLGVVALSADASLHTFCVLSTARGRGVGHALMCHVVRSHGRQYPLHLTVAGPTATGHGSAVLRKRHDRLVHFYGSYGFRRTTTADGYTHMSRPPAPP